MTQTLTSEHIQAKPEKNEHGVQRDVIVNMVEQNMKLAIEQYEKNNFSVPIESIKMETDVLFDHVFDGTITMPIGIHFKEEDVHTYTSIPTWEDISTSNDQSFLVVNEENMRKSSPHVEHLHFQTGALLAENESIRYTTVNTLHFVETVEEDGEEKKQIQYSLLMQALSLATRANIRENLRKTDDITKRDNLILVSLKNWEQTIKEIEYDNAQEEQLLRIIADSISTESFRYAYTLRVNPPLLETGLINTSFEGTAIEQLERYEMFLNVYSGHNPSVTIHIKQNEWDDVQKWLSENWDNYIAVQFKQIND